MKVVVCDRSFSEPIRAIFNDAIENSTALYEYVPRTPERMAAWFDGKEQGRYPFRRRGVGRRLLQEIIAAAQRQGYHAMIGAIDSNNATSIALHRSLGFQPAGTLRQVGFKFGQWLDLDFYQLLLPTPSQPVDG